MKKLLTILVVLSMILTLTVTVSAAGTNQPIVSGTDILWPEDLPKDTEIIDISGLKDGETLEIDLYIQNPNASTRASFSIPYATLVIRKLGKLITWNFVPLPITGNPFHTFNGSTTTYNTGKLSMGTEYVSGPPTGSRTYYAGGIFSISGTHWMLGWGSSHVTKVVAM